MRSGVKWPLVYAGKCKDASIREKSRSGGAFTVISDLILNSGGVVYGCVLTDDFKAIHQRAEESSLRNKMRGSKYIQSNLGETFRRVKEDLKSGRKVLFSGTSCQVAGLRRFLSVEYDNLLCVDIVCHGVPSKNVWERYLQWQKDRTKKNIIAVDFRNKQDFGWAAHVETLTMDDGSKVNSRVFKNLFYGHKALRPSCYECPYKDVIHPGDITIADYWGIEKAAPGFNDNKGVSLILVNTDKGNDVFESCKSELAWKKTRIEDSMQTPLRAPFPQPKDRDAFWNDFNTMNFTVLAKRYGGYGCVNAFKKKVRGLKKRIARVIKS